MDLITRLEEAILVAILRLEGDAYGVTINREVSRIFSKTYTMGALYFSLDQLHQKDLVSKTVADPSPERGGKSKTFYRLTKEGKSALDAVRRHHESLWSRVPGINYEGIKPR
jgi:PadR family transcriptional regulator, regulatory protein PadR